MKQDRKDKKFKGKKWIIGCIVLLAAAAVIAVLVTSPQSVNTYEVIQGNVDETVFGTGSIEADNELTIYAPVSGKLSHAIYKTGDSVTENLLLASYDTTDFEEAYALAESNVQYYTHGYSAAKYEKDRAQTKYDNSSADAQTYEGQYSAILAEMSQLTANGNSKALEAQEELQNLQRDSADYETELTDLRVQQQTLLTKIETLRCSIQEYDTQVELAEEAVGNLNSRKSEIQNKPSPTAEELAALTEIILEIKNYESQMYVYEDQRAELVSLKNSLTNDLKKIEDEISAVNSKIKDTAGDVAKLPADGMTAEEFARYTELQKELDLVARDWAQSLTDKATADSMLINDSALNQYADSVTSASIERNRALRELTLAEEGVLSGVDGVIVEKYVDDGQYVEAGQALYTIQPTCGYKASVMISKYDIGKISQGQSAEITVGSSCFTGTVSKIMQVSQIDSSGKPKVKVEILLDSTEDVPAIGLETEVTIFVRNAEDVIYVPNEAMYSDDSGDYLYVAADGKAEKRYVTLMFAGEDNTVITDGLQAGETVILDAMTDADVGSRVK